MGIGDDVRFCSASEPYRPATPGGSSIPSKASENIFPIRFIGLLIVSPVRWKKRLVSSAKVSLIAGILRGEALSSPE